MIFKSLPYLALSLVLSVSYPARLTRKTAAKMLAPHIAAFPAKVVRIWLEGMEKETTESLKKRTDGLGVLARLGYVECTITPEHYRKGSYTTKGRIVPAACDVTFTEKGKEASAGWKVLKEERGHLSTVDISIGRPEFVTVTGISMDGASVASVLYGYRYAAINEIGVELVDEEDLLEGSAKFRKFDDGWRLVS